MTSIYGLVISEMAKTTREYVVTTPYLIPLEAGLERVREKRSRGIRIVAMTNSLASTDQPFAFSAYRRYRRALLEAGVELYEVSPRRGSRLVREALQGEPAFRLHIKSVVFDREWSLFGSLNFDPRSRNYNTETALIIKSPQLARDVLRIVDELQLEAAYRVRLRGDGGIEWVAVDDDGTETLRAEPESAGFWSRLVLELLAPFVPEGLL